MEKQKRKIGRRRNCLGDAECTERPLLRLQQRNQIQTARLSYRNAGALRLTIMIRPFAILLLSAAIALLATLAQAETLNVHLVLSDSTAPYQQFSSALNKALAANKANITIVEHAGNSVKADLTIAVGMKATELAIAES